MCDCRKDYLKNLKVVDLIVTSGWRKVPVNLRDDIGVTWVDELLVEIQEKQEL